MMKMWHDNDNGYEKDDEADDDNVGDNDNGDESGGWLMMMIVMTIKLFVRQLAYLQKPKQLWQNSLNLITNCSKEDNPEQISKDPGMKILG